MLSNGSSMYATLLCSIFIRQSGNCSRVPAFGRGRGRSGDSAHHQEAADRCGLLILLFLYNVDDVGTGARAEKKVVFAHRIMCMYLLILRRR